MSATVSGSSFISLQVRDLEGAAAFYERELGLTRAAFSPPHAVVFDTTPIPFALRDPAPGTDLDSGPVGLGVALWFLVDDTAALHERLVADGVEVITAPFDGPFGSTLVLRDPDGYALTVHDSASAAG